MAVDRLKERIESAVDDIYNKAQEAYSGNKVMISGLQISSLANMDSMEKHFKSMSFQHPKWNIQFKQQLGRLDGSGGVQITNNPTLTFYDIGDDYKDLLLAYENGYDACGRPITGPLSITFTMEVYRPKVSDGSIAYVKEYELKFTEGRITEISTRKMDTSAGSSGLEIYNIKTVFEKEVTQ